MRDPRPALQILEALKDNPDLYVRRSVPNHFGEIAKDHPTLAFEICARWAKGASEERNGSSARRSATPRKKGVAEALRLRRLATAG